MERLFTWGICETAALENYSQKCLNKNQREELLHYFDVRRRQKYISEAEPFLNKDGDTKDIWFDSLVQLMAQVGLKISTLQKDFEDSNDLGEETFSESIAGNEGNMQAFSQALQMLLILCYKPKMIFGKNSEDNQVEFERILGKIYKQLDDFFECGILFYMFRQKIDKREDSIKDYSCFLVDKDGLIESINATYVRYYLELRGIDIPVKRRPKVNTELISRCLETKSLLPMAHIILLRDAEYQMLDLKKYSNSKLLPYGGAENYVFTFDNLTEEKKKEIDALGRMMINLEDIKEFYTWSQKQAKASFILAVAMCISGFILMIGAIMLPVVFRLSFQMSIIPAIGGVITELIAGTALVVYRNSLSQLNHYHKALHEDERFLSSVNLLGKFSTVEAQDDMLREIIRSEIQMNLAGLKETEDKKSAQINKEENIK